MNPEGQLHIALRWDGERVREARIHSTRRTDAARIFTGQPPQTVLDRVPLIFSVCGKSQTLAARLACEAALGPPSESSSALTLALLLETIHEFLWRVLLDLPPHLGQAPQVERFSQLRRQLLKVQQVLSEDGSWKRLGAPVQSCDQALREALVQELQRLWRELSGTDLDSWLRLTHEPDRLLEGNSPLAQWLGALEPQGPSAQLLPTPIDGELVDALLRQLATQEGFAAQPQWQGQCVETGALARNQHHPTIARWLAHQGAGLRVRWLARLMELAQAVMRLMAPEKVSLSGQWRDQDGHSGGAWVETARGLLLHWVRLEQGRVTDYRILAPTEWNFHPQGGLIEALAQLRCEQEAQLKRQVGHWCLALDPCVAYELEVQHA